MIPGWPPNPGRPRPESRPPGDPLGQQGLPEWLQERLFARRLVLLSGYLDDAAATRAVAELLTLDAAGDEPIDLSLNCPDSTLEAAVMLMDTLELLRAPVHALCLGEVGGPAVGVLATARSRAATRNARFRLALPRIEVAGTPEQLAERSQRQQQLLERFQSALARATGQPVAVIARDLAAGRVLDAAEALRYGLIDGVSPAAR
jgi:ATP-dependent Clp protease protease subunit